MDQLEQEVAPPTKATVDKGQWNVLCVDDEKSVLNSLKRVLKTSQYNVFVASDAKEALWMMEYQPVDIIISDMMMPEMTGAEFLAQAYQVNPDTVRILLTGHADLDSTITAINDGRLDHFLHKPWDNAELLMILDEATKKLRLQRENKSMLETISRQNKQLAMLNKKLEQRIDVRTKQVRTALSRVESANTRAQANHRNTLRVFYNLISQNKNLQGNLAVEISDLCREMAICLGIEQKEARAIHLAGLLNELGLLCLPDEIATTPFVKMRKEQRAQFHSHPVLAAQALAPAIALSNVAEVIKHQYEHVDGSGTPDRIWGEQIPIGSRILSIVRDFVQAKASKGRNPNAVQESIDELTKQAGRWYDKALLELLPTVIAQYEANQGVDENERLVPTEDLEPGMELSRSVITEQELLLLSENHIFTQETIRRLRQYEISHKEKLSIYIFNTRKALAAEE